MVWFFFFVLYLIVKIYSYWFFLLQDSFYHNLTEEELTQVHDYNFDHPGECNFGDWSLKNIVKTMTCVEFQLCYLLK